MLKETITIEQVKKSKLFDKGDLYTGFEGWKEKRILEEYIKIIKLNDKRNETKPYDALFDNFKKLQEVVYIVTKNLNKIIDLNYYPVPETELSNKKHRPLGIGVQGLADVFINKEKI